VFHKTNKKQKKWLVEKKEAFLDAKLVPEEWVQ
jgi:hypothetical protein